MGLTRDYDDLVELVRGYEKFAASFGARSVVKLATSGGIANIRELRSPFSRPQPLIDAYRRISTEKDRANPFFGALVSGHPYESLASSFVSDHPWLRTPDVQALAEIHRLHWDRHQESSWRRNVAAVIAVAAFAGQFFNEDVFATMQWTGYGMYRTILAFGVAFLALYIIVMFATLSATTRGWEPVRNVELVFVIAKAIIDTRSEPVAPGHPLGKGSPGEVPPT